MLSTGLTRLTVRTLKRALDLKISNSTGNTSKWCMQLLTKNYV